MAYDSIRKLNVGTEIQHLRYVTRKLDRRYFAQFYESIKLPGMMAIIMELGPGLDLADFLYFNDREWLTEFTIHKIFQDVFKGTFAHFHST